MISFLGLHCLGFLGQQKKSPKPEGEGLEGLFYFIDYSVAKKVLMKFWFSDGRSARAWIPTSHSTILPTRVSGSIAPLSFSAFASAYVLMRIQVVPFSSDSGMSNIGSCFQIHTSLGDPFSPPVLVTNARFSTGEPEYSPFLMVC